MPARSPTSSPPTPASSWVSFLGFPDNPYYELAPRYLGERVPVDHDLRACTAAARPGIAVFNSVKLFKRLLNMGDAKSLITHPASTTHRQLTPTDLELVGITPDMVRLSIGLEHPDDLIEDLDQALAAPQRARRRARPLSEDLGHAGAEVLERADPAPG